MSSGEDWYPLAQADLQSSSDDELPKETSDTAGTKWGGAWEDLELRTPSQADTERRQQTDSEPKSPLPLENACAEECKVEPDGAEGPQTDFDEPASEEVDASGGNAQERWQRTDAYMRDVQSAFRTRPAVKVQSNERYMKLLLVGEPGLGKELFTKNVFAPYCADNDLPVNSCADVTEASRFARGAQDFCTEVVVDVDSGRTKIHYMIQDTPGTHLAGAETCILKFIAHQSVEYMAKEEDPRRDVPLGALPDPRVDVCLYFLAPHFLKPRDVAFMARLSELAPIVPVIARADALTTAELDAHRGRVREALQAESLRIGRPIMHSFSAKDLKAAGAVREVPPFAVITSTEVDHEVGSHWFTRTFPWGRCEVLSSSHSDLPALKALLFETCFESLKAATEARFYAARESRLTSRALSRALSSGELPAEDAGPTAAERRADNSSPTKPPRPAAPVGVRTPALTHRGAVRQLSAPRSKARPRWDWGVGLTVSVVAIALLFQAASLGLYARRTADLKALIEGYRSDAAADKQVIADLIRGLDLH